jgi:hypothetical protein
LAYTSATALASQPCYGCQHFHASEIRAFAAALRVDLNDLAVGGLSWRSADGVESVVVRAMWAPRAQADPVAAWVGVRAAAQPGTTSTPATIDDKSVRVLTDPTYTGWSATSYAYAHHDALFIVSYENSSLEPSRGVPGVVATLFGSLP